MSQNTMDILSQIKFEHSELIKAAESVLVAMARDPLAVESEDKLIFAKLGWDERQISRELGRVQAAMRWRPEAGTEAEYIDAIELSDALSKSVPKETAKLQAKIDESQQKLNDENAKLANAEKRLSGFDNARAQLRNFVPSFIRKKYDDEMRRVALCDQSERLRELQGRATMIRGVLDNLATITFANEREIRLHCESSLRAALPEPSPFPHGRHPIDETMWAAYIQRLRAELPGIESEILELQPSIDEQVAATQKILDYYLEGKK